MINNFHFRNHKVATFFVNLTLLLFDIGDCLPLNNGNALSFRNHKSNREKSKLSVKKLYDFFLKNSKTYIRVVTTFITL